MSPGRTFTREGEDRAGTRGCEIGEEEEIRTREGGREGVGKRVKLHFRCPWFQYIKSFRNDWMVRLNVKQRGSECPGSIGLPVV